MAEDRMVAKWLAPRAKPGRGSRADWVGTREPARPDLAQPPRVKTRIFCAHSPQLGLISQPREHSRQSPPHPPRPAPQGNTPKYGLIFHSTFIGRAAQKNKGRISRCAAHLRSIPQKARAGNMPQHAGFTGRYICPLPFRPTDSPAAPLSEARASFAPKAWRDALAPPRAFFSPAGTWRTSAASARASTASRRRPPPSSARR
jgi:hypothetical protein